MRFKLRDIWVCVGVLIAISAMAAYGEPLTAKQYQEQCRGAVEYLESPRAALDDPAAAVRTGACFAYTRGFLEGFMGAERLNGVSRSNWVCLPPGGTVQQYVLVVQKHLNEHPETLHHPMYIVFPVAMSLNFPCLEKSPPTK